MIIALMVSLLEGISINICTFLDAYSALTKSALFCMGYTSGFIAFDLAFSVICIRCRIRRHVFPAIPGFFISLGIFRHYSVILSMMINDYETRLTAFEGVDPVYYAADKYVILWSWLILMLVINKIMLNIPKLRIKDNKVRKELYANNYSGSKSVAVDIMRGSGSDFEIVSNTEKGDVIISCTNENSGRCALYEDSNGIYKAFLKKGRYEILFGFEDFTGNIICREICTGSMITEE